MWKLAYILLSFLFPLALILAKEKLSIIKKISPIVLCYVFGILLGNLQIVSIPIEVAELISQLCVFLAIPLLLISTDLQLLRYQAKTGIISFFAVVFSVFISSLFTGFLFKNFESVDLVVGMLSGIFSGGTPNMASIYLALEIPTELYIKVSSIQIAVGGLYLIFLTTVGKSFFHKIVLNNDQLAKAFNSKVKSKNKFDFFVFLTGFLKSIILAIIIGLLSYGITYTIHEKVEIITLILCLTTISFLFSVSPRIRKTPFSFEIGDYLMLVFSFAIGSMANFSLLMDANFNLLLITLMILLFSIFLHTLICRFLKVDAETLIISSTASFYGPAFIGQVASAIGNRSLIAFGISCGILGYVLGTYLGLTVASLLNLILTK